MWVPRDEEDEDRVDGLDVLRDRYLPSISGNLTEDDLASGAAAARARALEQGTSRREAAAALLRGLPGIRLENTAAGLEPLDIYEENMKTAHELARDSPPLHSNQVPLDEWELRAIMEKRRRKEAQQQDWERRRSEIGLYPTLAADWRSDVRIRDTGDPTAPTYREWTHKEIWDLITMGGKAADPRVVRVTVEDPFAPADAVAEGAQYVPETEEWLEQIGKIIPREDEPLIADKQGEEAMLAAEFSDFDEEYLAPSGFSTTATTSSFDEFSAGGGDNF